MTRLQAYRDIEDTFGLVPVMFKPLSDASIDSQWELFKRIEFGEGPIPRKYRELIGLAVASVARCRYCAFYHTELAKFHGATDAEVESAVEYAMFTSAWSTYINGMQMDLNVFKDEIIRAVEHMLAKKTGRQ